MILFLVNGAGGASQKTRIFGEGRLSWFIIESQIAYVSEASMEMLLSLEKLPIVWEASMEMLLSMERCDGGTPGFFEQNLL